MAKSEFTGRSTSYIFENAGGMRDQLEQTILNKLQEKKYPLKATISTLKSGKGIAGALFGSKEQCVVIAIDDEAQIAISNTTVGTYLYVEVYLMVQIKLISFSALSAAIGDVFKIQYRNAVYAAAIAATESAFAELGLKQCNSGYKPTQSESKTDQQELNEQDSRAIPNKIRVRPVAAYGRGENMWLLVLLIVLIVVYVVWRKKTDKGERFRIDNGMIKPEDEEK